MDKCRQPGLPEFHEKYTHHNPASLRLIIMNHVFRMYAINDQLFCCLFLQKELNSCTFIAAMVSAGSVNCNN